jgi:hypothetical protein
MYCVCEGRGKKVLDTGRITGATQVISAKEKMKIKCGNKNKRMAYNGQRREESAVSKLKRDKAEGTAFSFCACVTVAITVTTVQQPSSSRCKADRIC